MTARVLIALLAAAWLATAARAQSFRADGPDAAMYGQQRGYPVCSRLDYLARGDTILFEKYRYGRNDKHRLTLFSMAKTITGMLVGLALRDGAIRSLDDAAQEYAKELEATARSGSPWAPKPTPPGSSMPMARKSPTARRGIKKPPRKAAFRMHAALSCASDPQACSS